MGFALSVWVLLPLILATSVALFRRFQRVPSSLSYPPGPPGLPILGNLFDRPQKYPWLTYQQWSKRYGSSLLRLNILGDNVVIINSADVASDLLEKRGTVYSDRPTFTMLRELCGFSWNTALLPYGAEWRNARRVFQRGLGPLRVKQHRSEIFKGVRRLLRSTLSSPDDIFSHFKLLTGAQIFGVAYGLDIREASDPYLEDAKISSECFSAAAYPGAYGVDILPLLQYVPEWFPGAGFKREAREWRKTNLGVRDRPFAAVKARMARGEDFDCAAKSLIESIDPQTDSSLMEDDIRSVLGTMYIAGADTSMSSLGFFVFAMVVNPDIQAKAQAIIDQVCPGRLPTFDDMSSLPFVDALVKETLRWRPILPLSIPHKTSEDDVYNGFFIPKGTQVVENSWAILHDEKMYPNPEKFDPERWLRNGKLDLDIRQPEASFGGGRRICPGRFLAYEVLWITMACLLATFDFKMAKDKYGNDITPEEETVCGVVCRINPFLFDVKPRSQEHEKLVRTVCDDE